MEVGLTPEVIVKKFFAKEIVPRIISISNRYREQQMEKSPDRDC